MCIYFGLVWDTEAFRDHETNIFRNNNSWKYSSNYKNLRIISEHMEFVCVHHRCAWGLIRTITTTRLFSHQTSHQWRQIFTSVTQEQVSPPPSHFCSSSIQNVISRAVQRRSARQLERLLWLTAGISVWCFLLTLLESVSGDQLTPEQLRRRLETTDLNRPEETKNHVFVSSPCFMTSFFTIQRKESQNLNSWTRLDDPH